MFVINWEGREGLVSCQSKLFEYLAAQRPILATGGLGNYQTRELLDETKAGIHTPTIEEVKSSLKKLYQQYKLKGGVVYSGDAERISKYSHREMSRKFSEILNHLVCPAASAEVTVQNSVGKGTSCRSS